MFDFAGSEIALVAVVALILIGPKDLPVAVKAVTGMIKKARRMAAEFQVHVDDMMKDADLGELRSGLNEIRRMDIKGRILNAIDDDGSLRKSVTDVKSTADSMATPAWTPPPAPVPAGDAATPASITPASITPASITPATNVPDLPTHTIAAPEVLAGDPMPAPAFIPPRAARAAPAFIPPACTYSGAAFGGKRAA